MPPSTTASLADCTRVILRKLPFLRDWLRILLAPAWRRHLIAAERRRSARYPAWARDNATLTPDERDAIRRRIDDLPEKPLISLLMPVHNPPQSWLESAIASVESQLWPEWELCICDNASTLEHVETVLKNASPRISLVRRAEKADDATACNDALALANGNWVALLEPGCLLAPEALYEFANVLLRHPQATMIYSDEDRLSYDGQRHSPIFKPAFDPELLLTRNFIGSVALFRADLVSGFPTGEALNDDLTRRWAGQLRTGQHHILHIPRILCHQRHESAANHVAQPHGHLPLPDPEPRVSIIIPTRDHSALLSACVDSILERTAYTNLEILICDNNSSEPATAALFQRLAANPRVRILPMQEPFNYSRLNNQATQQATGDILLLLNNDVEAINPQWLSEMASLASRPEIGAVGAKLLYPDGTLQHGGVVLGIGWPGGVAGHFMPHAQPHDTDDLGWLTSVHTVSAVTAACLAVRRSVYQDAGGLNETDLAVAFNDIDFCLRLQAAGYRNLWTPFAELCHKESASRGSDLKGAKARRMEREVAWMRQRWGHQLDTDPFWNPNLSLMDGYRHLAARPRDRTERSVQTWSDP